MGKKQNRFDDFIKLLGRKKLSPREPLNEALLRYYYATYACTEPEGVLMEVPINEYIVESKKHLRKKNSHCKFDFYYKKDDTAIEFKYHRSTNNSRSCTTSKAGAAFKDLNRLSLLRCREKYFIYVFDEDMKNYYTNNATYKLFSMNEAEGEKVLSSSFDVGKGEFRKVAFSGFEDAEAVDFKKLNYSVTRLAAKKLANGLYLMIFEIS